MKSDIVAVLRPPEELEEMRNPKPKIAAEPGPQVNDVPQVALKVEPPLSAFEKINGKPYSVDFFKVQEWDYPELDVDKKREQVSFIENWVNEKIKEDKLEDSTESYKEIMQAYFGTLNIGKTEKNESKLERVYSYLKIMKKQKELDKRRGDILGSRN